jgi:hypothetical protein
MYRVANWEETASLRHRSQTGSRVHVDSYAMGTGGLSPGVKRPGREAEHSPPSSPEVKNARNNTSTPPYVFIAWYFIKHRNDFTLCGYNLPPAIRKFEY